LRRRKISPKKPGIENDKHAKLLRLVLLLSYASEAKRARENSNRRGEEHNNDGISLNFVPQRGAHSESCRCPSRGPRALIVDREDFDARQEEAFYRKSEGVPALALVLYIRVFQLA
jgi:hypothetical protein